MDTAEDRKDGFSVLGIGAAACVACCAPLILGFLGFLGGLGLASTFWFGALGLVLIAVALVGLAVVHRRRRPAVAACAGEGACGCT